MGEESLIVRLTALAQLALAYYAFTKCVDCSKRPIRKIVESSIDPIGELLSLCSSLWSTAAPSSASEQANRSHAHPKKTHGWGFSGTKSADAAVKSEKPQQKLAKLAVEDLCESCRDAWIMAEQLNSSFQHLSGVNCMDDLFQPCTLCSERVQGLSRLERTLFEQNSPENLSEALRNACAAPETGFNRNRTNLHATV